MACFIACDEQVSSPAKLALPPAVESAPERIERFVDATTVSGLNFKHFSAGSSRYYFPEIMGSGVAVLDYDRDGDLDVFAAQGSLLDEAIEVTELRDPSQYPQGDRLYENRLIPDGTLLFRDVTARAGINTSGYSMGIATGDVDNDGNIDIYITRFGANVLLRNLGDGSFVETENALGADDSRWNTSASFFDFDADGDLDLFVTAYVAFTLRYEKTCQAPTGDPDYCSPGAYRALLDRFYENEDGHFHDITQEIGLGGGVSTGLGSVFDDFNKDGRFDLYVANDGKPNFLWKAKSDGTFYDDGVLAGAAYNMDGNSEASMGVVSGDFDNDGDPDLFMTHLRGETNTLYRNDGSGGFTDATLQVNLTKTSMPRTGFGTVWLDADNDGWQDLFVANGGVTTNDHGRRTDASYAELDQLWLNKSGTRFVDVSRYSGHALQEKLIGRGVAKGDLDNDGDLDLIVSNNNGPCRVLLNTQGQNSPWLRVQLEGRFNNARGLGAMVALLEDDVVASWQRVRTDGSYLSASEPVAHFGLGDAHDSYDVAVIWPNGKSERWSDIHPMQLITLVEGTGERWEPP